MDIYVVQEGDNVYLIAEKYGVAVDKLIQDNGLQYPFNLIIGQALVITYPVQSHTVQQGDTLQSIAALYNISLMQILRNNPYLSDRNNLIEGESLVISYNIKRSITTNGFAYPFIKKETLITTLPSLTYLSIFNYSTTENGNIISYQADDEDIIKTTKDYGVIPLMMLSTLSQQGEPNIETAYNVLLNVRNQENNINQLFAIIEDKGYQGINLVLNFLNEDNQSLYDSLLEKLATRLQENGLLFFITINYRQQVIDNQIVIEQVDYGKISSYVNGMIFLKFLWGTNYGPPAPVSNITNFEVLIDYVLGAVTPDKIILGKPVLGYDWSLPYIPNRTSANSLSINHVYDLAYNVDTTIQFDEESQTPFFYYNQYNIGLLNEHIVWFIDARSIKALTDLIIEDNLNGSGVWNIMIFNPQLWSVINSQFDIVKISI